jgi:ProP effector
MTTIARPLLRLSAKPASKPKPPPAPKQQSRWRMRWPIYLRAMETRSVLAKHFPKCFADFKQPKRPLKIGIVSDIIAALPDFDRHDLINAVTNYCNGKSYHAAMLEGAPRIDLHGNSVGVVSERDATYATGKLKSLMAARAPP